jgi:hypothetical protein
MSARSIGARNFHLPKRRTVSERTVSRFRSTAMNCGYPFTRIIENPIPETTFRNPSSPLTAICHAPTLGAK